MRTKGSKLSQVSAYLAGILKHVKFFFDINGLKYMVLANLLCIGGGRVAIHFAEGMSILDGIWWAFVTATTVGYGDISPSTPFGRIIAAILMLVGIGLSGSLTSTITAMFFQPSGQSAEGFSCPTGCAACSVR